MSRCLIPCALGSVAILFFGCTPKDGSTAADRSAIYRAVPVESKPVQTIGDLDSAETVMEKLVKETEAAGSVLDGIEAWRDKILADTVPDSTSGGKAIYEIPDFLQKFDSQQHSPEVWVTWDSDRPGVFVHITWSTLPAGHWPVLYGFVLCKPGLAPASLPFLKRTYRELKPGVFLYTFTFEGQHPEQQLVH